MLTLEQMMVRLVVALLLGAVVGLERELVGKEAGIRTSMLVASGSAIFTMIALVLPFIVAPSPEYLPDIIARNGGFLAVIANIVVGIGFLGAGIIIKTQERVHGLTTAALVWTTAAIGTLAGLGLTSFATIATVLIATLLYILRKAGVDDRLNPKNTETRSSLPLN
mgnify:CR=1 FL=1